MRSALSYFDSVMLKVPVPLYIWFPTSQSTSTETGVLIGSDKSDNVIFSFASNFLGRFDSLML